MVNDKTRKVESKSVGGAGSSAKKTTAKTTSKKKSIEQKKKSSVKNTKTAKTKKPVTKKVEKKSITKNDTKKPSAKKPAKAKETAVKKTTTKAVEKKKPVRKPVKKQTASVASKGEFELGIKKASKSELKKVDNVIGNFAKTSKQTKKTKGLVITTPGVFRRVPALKKAIQSDHQVTPIQAIMNYIKNMF